MSEAEGIIDRMVEVRARGLRKARELNADIERLGDWREHVRAHPWPIALAALAAGYYVVPTKSDSARKASQQSSPGAFTASSTEKERVAEASGARGAVVGFIGSLAANAIRSFIASRIRDLLNGNSHDQAPFQRQTSHRG